MKYNIAKLSELTGFSPATVSNALNNKKGVNRETAEKIIKVAREVGYLSAPKISSIKLVIYKVSGLVIADTPFFIALIEGVERACRETGYDMTVCNISQKDADYQERLQELIMDTSSAILLSATELMESDMELFTHAVCPVVVLDAWFHQMQFDTAVTNNEDSTHAAVDYLIKNGHRDIGFLDSSTLTKNFLERRKGYYFAMREHHLHPRREMMIGLTPTMDGAYKDMCEFLKGKVTLPTAFVAGNDIIALGAMKAMKEFGYRIPDDVSLVGFDDMPFCEISTPTLTTIRFYQQELGRMAVERLTKRIKNPELVPIRIQISTKLIVRESVKQLDMEKAPLWHYSGAFWGLPEA